MGTLLFEKFDVTFDLIFMANFIVNLMCEWYEKLT
jgi:hypothetical protein